MRVILMSLVFLFPLSVSAQAVCGPQDYDSKQAPNFACPGPEEDAMVPELNPPPSVPLQQGKAVEAPWDGALVHRDRLVEYGLRLKALRRLRWADRLYIAERYRIEIEHLEAVATIRDELTEEQLQYHQQRARTAERAVTRAQAWYRSWGFGFLSGFIASGLLVALAVYVGVAL